MAGGTYFKLEMNLVKLFLHDQFVLKFHKVNLFLHKGRRQMGHFEKWVILPLEFNRGDETEKQLDVFLSTLGMHLVLQFGDDAVFSQCLKNRKIKT